MNTTKQAGWIGLCFMFAMSAWAQPIVVAQTADFSKAAAPVMKEFAWGAQTYFNHINDTGGVNGKRIEYRKKDDAFNPDLTLKNAQSFLEDKDVIAFFGPRGTPNVKALLELAEKERVPVVAPLIGAALTRSGEFKMSYPLRASYKQEAEVGIKHAIAFGKRLAVLGPSDAYGNEMRLFVTSEVQKKYGNEGIVLSNASYDRESTNLKEAAEALAKTKPNAVMMFCSANACASFLKEWEKIKNTHAVYGTVFIANSIVDLKAQREALGDVASRLMATQIVPPVGLSLLPSGLEQVYSKALKAEGKSTSYSLFEGFLSAHVLVEAMKRAKKPGREALIKSLEVLDLELGGGMRVNMAQRFQEVQRYVDLVAVNGQGRFVR
jgi:branched-chain amino acid transport system substrate-binding protein